MSFILDALRKSESERQRQGAPGFADIPSEAGRRRTPRWMWALGILLAVNAVALAGLLLRPDPAPGDTTEAVAETPKDPAGPTFSTIVADAKRTVPRPAVTAADSRPPARNPARGATTPAPSVADTDGHTTAEPPAVRPAASSAPPSGEPLPLFSELRVRGKLQLPDLHLDIHVYSANPADRFVFINMTKYREKATLSEGPSVRTITGDGVILEYKGTEFLLPRE